MIQSPYYDILLAGVGEELTVRRIVRGVSWTAAQLSDGRCGVAMHTAGDTAPRLFDTLEGLSARQAAQAALSWNFEEASEGMAVVNAWYNTAENAGRLGVTPPEGALDGLSLDGLRVGFVGHLPGHSGITEELLSRAKDWFILEREPRPGDLPDTACEYLLPGCDLVVVTGSAAVNKTMPRLLELAKNARVVLTGPTVTLCPALLELGIDRLYGLAITEGEEMLRSIVEKRGSVNRFGRRFCVE